MFDCFSCYIYNIYYISLIFHIIFIIIVQTQDPGVPASVPRTTADVTSPTESCSIVSVSNLKILLVYKSN